MMILNPLKKVQKIMRKSYQQKSDMKMELLTFIAVFKSFRPLTFIG
jgi:hypothetical protein